MKKRIDETSEVVIVVSSECLRQVQNPENVAFVLEHFNDPNYPLVCSESDFDTESTDRVSGVSALDFEDESPYPEVRAAVSNVDDVSMPVNTFRTWFLGIFYTLLVAALNQVLAMRYPTVLVSSLVVQLVSLPSGKALEAILPTKQFRTFGTMWSLNPGPFNVKEHVVISIMANVASYGTIATDIVAAQRLYYGQVVPLHYQILLAFCIQIFGIAIAGIFSQFLVWPSAMIWPGALVNAALLNTLHSSWHVKESKKHVSRRKFFLITLACSFIWYWVPGYLWTGLSFFNWVCWIAPNNVVVNQVFGTVTGLGLGMFTFDWATIAYIGSPLVTPWWTEANIAAAFVLVVWIITPIIYYTNTWYSKYLPISSYLSFNNQGLQYEPQAVFTDGVFDVERYNSYSPLYLSPTLALAYAVAFAAFTSVMVHVFLWYRHDIMKRFRSGIQGDRDVHSRLMQAYPEVPRWWYALVGLVSLLMGIVAVELFPTQLPIWGLLVAIVIPACWCLPIAMIKAVTNQDVFLNVIAELIPGYILPHKPVANMISKALGTIVSARAIAFLGDLKLGHYMKIPPRTMFIAQLAASAITCVVSMLVQQWMFSSVADICTPDQKGGFSCPSTHTFATASLVWGGIGPAKLFSPGALYSPLLWGFLVGALAPIPFYLLSLRYPLSFWRYINTPAFFAGLGAIPPATGLNYSTWAITGFVFQYYIRRFHLRWWMRYNYLLSAALDAGVAIALVFIFLALQFPKGGMSLQWWGNTVWQDTADAQARPLLVLGPGETFGPLGAS